MHADLAATTSRHLAMAVAVRGAAFLALMVHGQLFADERHFKKSLAGQCRAGEVATAIAA